MELALLVYAISILTGLNIVLILTSIISSTVWFVCKIIPAIDEDQPQPKYIRRLGWIAAISTVLLIGIPTEKTAYLMVGAYSAQKIAERPETADITKDVMTIINAKVKKYAEEAVNDLKKGSK